MIKDALAYLFTKGQEAAKPEILPPGPDAGRGDKPRVTRLTVGGKLHTIRKPNQRAELYALEDFVAYAVSNWADTSAVFVDACGAEFIADQSDQRDRARFQFHKAKGYRRLLELVKDPQAYAQRYFVRMLQRDLNIPTDQVAKFRRLDWRAEAGASGEVAHQASRLGKTIAAEVQGTGELPETLTADLFIYSNPDLRQRYAFELGVEIDLENQQLEVVPDPDEIDANQAAEIARIVDELRAGLEAAMPDEAVAIYTGSSPENVYEAD